MPRGVFWGQRGGSLGQVGSTIRALCPWGILDAFKRPPVSAGVDTASLTRMQSSASFFCSISWLADFRYSVGGSGMSTGIELHKAETTYGRITIGWSDLSGWFISRLQHFTMSSSTGSRRFQLFIREPSYWRWAKCAVFLDAFCYCEACSVLFVANFWAIFA